MAGVSLSPAHINQISPLKPCIEAWRIFLDDQGRSIHTIKAFVADVNLLAGFLSPDRQVGSISTKDLNVFLEWMQHERGVPCSPKTLSRRITSLKSFFKWLNDKAVISIDPAERVVQKSVLSPLPAVLDREEVALVLDVADKFRSADRSDARPYALLKFLLDTGVKKGELLALSTNHLELEVDSPFVFIRYGSPNHRYKERKISLTPEWIKAFYEYRAQYDLSQRLFPWSPRRLEYLLQELGEQAGIETQLSFLMCRWTSALTDYLDNVEPIKIRQKLGVSEIQWREINMKLQKLVSG
ncbi:MAG: phage integrase N-terminal SAM-like domain-containing protein [Chloroflexi bacterium]|nr:phage integrase N-terminal SAM-like domain-containing protein [Chloroflexota bacterium]